MFKNIKLIGVIFLSVLLLTNCKKENKDDSMSPGEIVFAAIDYDDSEKSGFDVPCVDGLIVDHAQILLKDESGNEVYHYPLTFTLDNKLYTQSLKLAPGYYIILEFSLRTADGTMVKATPESNSAYAGYVTHSIDGAWGFTVVAFEKEEFAIDVLCFIPAVFDLFGFEWFQVTEITLREQCFFGDICIDDFQLYDGSLYDNPLVNDEVAIFKINVFRDGNFVEDFENYDFINNEFYKDADNNYIPLCVQYADFDLVVNNFEFELWIWTTIGYEYFHSWTFADDQQIPSNNFDYVPGYDDGVVDFVFGDCVVTPSDLVLTGPIPN